MRRLALLLVLVSFVACFSASTNRRSSNVMDYLFPNATVAPDPGASQVRLQLPLRVGIAFVPASQTSMWYGAPILPADAETRLLEIVRRSFEGRDWVREVVLIPSTYLTPRGGFANLEQVARLYNTDVIALASVDQIQHTDPSPLSFLYISIVGSYLLPLDKNDTRTLIDAAVFHVPSRKFLLRAPGQSHVKGRSTAIAISEELREDSQKGFEMAMTDLTKNLSTEVDVFKNRVAEGAVADVDIVTRSGESVRQNQSGSMEWPLVLLAAMLTIWIARKQRWTTRSH